MLTKQTFEEKHSKEANPVTLKWTGFWPNLYSCSEMDERDPSNVLKNEHLRIPIDYGSLDYYSHQCKLGVGCFYLRAAIVIVTKVNSLVS